MGRQLMSETFRRNVWAFTGLSPKKRSVDASNFDGWTTPSVAPSSAPSKKPSDTPSLAPSFRPTIVIELKDSTVSLVSSPSVPCWGGVPSCVIISVILFGVHYLLFPALLFGY